MLSETTSETMADDTLARGGTLSTEIHEDEPYVTQEEVVVDSPPLAFFVQGSTLSEMNGV